MRVLHEFNAVHDHGNVGNLGIVEFPVLCIEWEMSWVALFPGMTGKEPRGSVGNVLFKSL